MARTRPNRHLIGLSVIVVLVVLGWWVQRQDEVFSPPVVRVDDRIPDYYLKDFSVSVMSDTGALAHRLEGRSLHYFADDDTADLNDPLLRFYRDDGEVWVMRSRVAKAFGGGDSLLLGGEVTVHRQFSAELPWLTMTSRDLWVYPERKYAESGESVLIQEGVSRIQGSGVKIDLAAGHLALMSAVRGSYVFADR